MELEEKLREMKDFLSHFNSAIVAFSGGVDSATLAALCKEVIKKVLAITVRSEVSPSREIEKALIAAEEIGVKHRFIDLDILKVEGFSENSEMRCYYCKKFLIKALVDIAIAEKYDVVLEGTNASDLKGHRPGYRAVVECDIAFSPWADFGIKKEEIRSIARSMGFSFYNSPSLACLASRIPFGVRITRENLRMIDEAENAVIRIARVGMVRVRNIDGFAVVEVEKDEISHILEKKEKIKDFLLKIGFKDVFINPNGYKTGVFVSKIQEMLKI
ncbi:MAG: ATP-dependent sacrificial sulfur transferase LarE [Archaeoglobaceae archaeon]|nr:ATP-dependent sacrificial sulfur transferase LarE [Archaeoglobaceae archaeon]